MLWPNYTFGNSVLREHDFSGPKLRTEVMNVDT